uniref:Uncharacterized protein n=1 Tax=Vespula pensylvanica TaxID=30213 RepID=A0A834UA52_VESPE|nr:hypothetical protein H0235_008032 [Vespula pensylvanica]
MVEESKEQSRTRNKRCPLSVCELRAAVWQRPSTSGAGHVTVLAAERVVRFRKGILKESSIQFRFRLTAPYCGQLGAEILSTGVTEEETLLTANRMFTRSGSSSSSSSGNGGRNNGIERILNIPSCERNNQRPLVDEGRKRKRISMI